jgi:hypothetical protein
VPPEEEVSGAMTTIRPEFRAIYETAEVRRHDMYYHPSIWPMEKDSARVIARGHG